MHTGPLYQGLCFSLRFCLGFTYSTLPTHSAHMI